MMSDEELDFSWKSNNRPHSTLAENFSLALNDLFKIGNSISDLDAAVCEKKKAVSTQTLELEELEARLKATEEQLKKAGIDPSIDKDSQKQQLDPYNAPEEISSNELPFDCQNYNPTNSRQVNKDDRKRSSRNREEVSNHIKLGSSRSQPRQLQI